MLRKSVILLIVFLGCVSLSGCATTEEILEPSDGNSSVTAPKDEQSHSKDIIEQLNTSLGRDGAYIFSPARPSYVVNANGQKTIMTIADQDTVDHQPGLYSLTTACVGTGMVNIEFMIGDDVNNGKLVCESSPRSGIVSMRIEQVKNGLHVKIIPSEDCDAEIAYRVDIS